MSETQVEKLLCLPDTFRKKSLLYNHAYVEIENRKQLKVFGEDKINAKMRH